MSTRFQFPPSGGSITYRELSNSNKENTRNNYLLAAINDLDDDVTRLEGVTGIQLGLQETVNDINYSSNKAITDATSLITALGALDAAAAMVAGDNNFTGQNNFSRADDPASPNNGDIWYNSTDGVWKIRINGVSYVVGTSVGPALPSKGIASEKPEYTTTTTYTVPRIYTKDINDVRHIIKTTSTTVNISTIGLNGILQSGNLAGTIGTGGSPSTTITGSSTTFQTDFVVGDVIWTASGARRITAIASQTSLTVESAITLSNGTAYRRGGLAPNTMYNQYEVADNNNANVGIILTTRSQVNGQTVVDWPANYGTIYRQSRFAVRSNASSQVESFVVGSGWPYRPKIVYPVAETIAGNSVLNGGSATSWTSVACSAWIPPISQLVDLIVRMNNNATAGRTELRPTGSGLTAGFRACTQTNNTENTCWITDFQTNSSQQVDYQVSNSSQQASIYIHGYTVTAET